MGAKIGGIVDVVDQNQAEHPGEVFLEVGDVLCLQILPVSPQPVLVQKVKNPPEKLGEALCLHQIRVGAEDEKLGTALFEKASDAVVGRLIQMYREGKSFDLVLCQRPGFWGSLYFGEHRKPSLEFAAVGENPQHRYTDPGEELAPQHAGVGDLVPLLPVRHESIHRQGCHRDRDRQEGKVLKDIELGRPGIPEDQDLEQVECDGDGDERQTDQEEHSVLFHEHTSNSQKYGGTVLFYRIFWGTARATAERGELVIQNKQELHKELQTGFYRSLRISIFAADCDFSGGLLALIFAEC